MAVNVSIEINRSFRVGADLERAFKLLANVPESASYFPNVAALTDLGENCYRWEMEKIGIEKYSLQICYASCYKAFPDDGRIVWTAVKGEGNGQVNGRWNLSDNKEGVTCRLITTAKITLPLPGMLKIALSPLVKREFTGKVEKYIDNLQQALRT